MFLILCFNSSSPPFTHRHTHTHLTHQKKLRIYFIFFLRACSTCIPCTLHGSNILGFGGPIIAYADNNQPRNTYLKLLCEHNPWFFTLQISNYVLVFNGCHMMVYALQQLAHTCSVEYSKYFLHTFKLVFSIIVVFFKIIKFNPESF